MAQFQFWLRGEKRKFLGSEIDNSSAPKVARSTSIAVYAPKEPDDVNLALVDTSSGNITLKLVVSPKKVTELEKKGIIKIKHVSKSPDGKQLKVVKDDSKQVLASSSLPKSAVRGYLSGFPAPTIVDQEVVPTKKAAPKKAKKVCAVATCSDPQDKHYFMFPKKNDSQRKMWIRAARRNDRAFNPNNARMCETHFTSKMFQRDLRSELLGTPARKILVENAVPTLNLPKSTYSEGFPHFPSIGKSNQVEERITTAPWAPCYRDQEITP